LYLGNVTDALVKHKGDTANLRGSGFDPYSGVVAAEQPDLPTIICIKHNGDENPEDKEQNYVTVKSHLKLTFFNMQIYLPRLRLNFNQNICLLE
jgi:hypothetical protein